MANEEHLVFRVHAIQRMFQRGISEDIVRRALETTQTIQHQTAGYRAIPAVWCWDGTVPSRYIW